MAFKTVIRLKPKLLVTLLGVGHCDNTSSTGMLADQDKEDMNPCYNTNM
jgi:hypothetical protein